MENLRHWYQFSIEDTFIKLEANGSGLTSQQAANRLLKFGPNELKAAKPNIFKRFLRQFNNPLIYVLLIAAAITGGLTVNGEDMLADVVVILGVIILNVILGFVQEGKTESALEALKNMLVPECMVLRDSEQKIIATGKLVPGDVVLLTSGDRVPADLRLFYVRDIKVDESALTGESVPIDKNISSIAGSNLSPGDQKCMAFSGTFIIRGTAKGIVVSTAEGTEFGKIARLVKETRRTTTPLQRKIADFTRTLMIAIFILGVINFILGYFFGFSFSYSFLATIALIVAAMPEMLPMLVTSIMALATSSMAKRHALIRLLPAAETLGGVTVICSDKTGTLTKNEMTVVKIFAGGKIYSISGAGYTPIGDFLLNGNTINPKQNSVLVETLKAGYFSSNASLTKVDARYELVGDPTEGAMVVAAAKAGVIDTITKLDEIPFESERMYMATLHEAEETNIVYVKGSPEVVLRMCRFQMTDTGTEPLNPGDILDKADEMASHGLRIIGVAYRHLQKKHRAVLPEHTKGLVFLGLQGMMDPPRPEAVEAVRKCRRAGIRTVMITGDHAKTARNIAHQLGVIENFGDGVLTGQELAIMSDDELFQAVKKVSVYARVAPEHKLRITKQLQKNGQIVAMTGDGVNDAPALRAADIGIAMGITGTEVSKEAASMILTDDNFASIVAAVEEGRHAWNNLEKAILYTLPTNGGQALLIMAAVLLAPFIPLFALRLPLEPIQILWINLFDSVFLTMPLMMEPKERGLLDVPPRDPKTNIVNKLFISRVGLVSIIMAGNAFLIYWIFGHLAINSGDVVLSQAQTAAFMTVVMVHLGYVLTARSTLNSAFTFSPFSNKWLLIGILVTIILDLLIVYTPALNVVFKTTAFPAQWWLLIITGLATGFFIPELEKAIRRRY